MTEQERSEEQSEATPTPDQGREANAPEASQAKAQGAERRPARAEAGNERKEREVAPAGPEKAVVPSRRRPPGQPLVSRRTVLRVGFWTSLGAVVAGAAACGLDLIYPRGVTGFGGKVTVGDVSQFPPGSKTKVAEGRFWLVHLTEEQGGPGLLALWWKCPHLGCTVPWREEFVWPDPVTGAPKRGWFRCPCHGSTYTDAGIRVFGPAPRSLDTMELTINNGRITVDTGKITPGAPDNPDRAVRV